MTYDDGDDSPGVTLTPPEAEQSPTPGMSTPTPDEEPTSIPLATPTPDEEPSPTPVPAATPTPEGEASPTPDDDSPLPDGSPTPTPGDEDTPIEVTPTFEEDVTPDTTGTPESSPFPTPNETPPSDNSPTPAGPIDADQDGYDISLDCDDGDPGIYPGAAESCDGEDNDCDGSVDEDVTERWYKDNDGDGYGSSNKIALTCIPPTGYVALDGDCNDDNASVYPGADEICDGLDNDCDGVTDPNDAIDAPSWYADGDGDGYGDPASEVTSCNAPEGYISTGEDCDDDDPSINPGATEICDGIDNNCDGRIDPIDDTEVRTWYADEDGDGFGNPDNTLQTCDTPDGYVLNDRDCNDEDDDVNPDADEYCDGIDNDCDGDVDPETSLDAPVWYADRDGDGYGDADDTLAACEAPDGYVALAGDCDDANSDANPDETSECPTQCTDDQGTDDLVTWYLDGDLDGFGDSSHTFEDCSQPSGYTDVAGDCDDSNPTIYPDAPEVCDGVDNDCDDVVDPSDSVDAMLWYRDADGDGYGVDAQTVMACALPDGYAEDDGDCDDADATVYPDADEVCDGLDNDCDGETDEGALIVFYPDTDGDGYGDDSGAAEGCEVPEGSVETGGDCDDDDASVHPGADEVCDGIDNDCDGEVDPDDAKDASFWYFDNDQDGYGTLQNTIRACEAPSGYVDEAFDCDDEDASVHPDAEEICDDKDNDCNSQVDDGIEETWYLDSDGDTYGNEEQIVLDCSQPEGYSDNALDCDDGDAAVNPDADEICDGIDNNCDDVIDPDEAVDAPTWYLDGDGDTYGNEATTYTSCEAPDGYVSNADDCNDGDASIHPDAVEVCDEVDQNCDGSIDNDAEDATVYYADADEDGYGDPDNTLSACEVPSGYVENGDDCNDGDASIHPEAEEVCDGIDSNCDEEDAPDVVRTYTIPDAFSTIQAALDIACDGDTLEVHAGTYVENIDFDGRDVTLVGLDGSENTTIMAADASRTVVDMDAGSMTGFTVQGGGGSEGAGIFIHGDGVSLVDVHVTGNEATDNGGGVAIVSAFGVSISDSVVEANMTDGEGGGIYAFQVDDLEIADSLLSANISQEAGGGLYIEGAEGAYISLDGLVADGNTGSYGGGFYLKSLASPSSLRDIVLIRNAATFYGGGLFCDAAFGSFSGVLIEENTAETGGGGAWITNPAGDSLTVMDVGILDNSAEGYGGLYSSHSSSEGANTYARVQITGNSSGDTAVAYFVGQVDLSNIIVSGNIGDGIALIPASTASTATLVNAAVVANTGDGLYLRPDGPDSITVVNSIVAYNGDFGVVNVSEGAEPSLFYNDVFTNGDGDYSGMESLTGQGGNVSTLPGFVAYSPTTSPSTWDLHLTSSSSLVDRGDTSLDDPDESRSDMGAYGGPEADLWDVDADGWMRYWDPLVGYTAGTHDCDDLDATVYPGHGC